MYITDKTTDRVNIYNRQIVSTTDRVNVTTDRVVRTTDHVNVYNRQSKYLQPTK